MRPTGTRVKLLGVNTVHVLARDYTPGDESVYIHPQGGGFCVYAPLAAVELWDYNPRTQYTLGLVDFADSMLQRMGYTVYGYVDTLYRWNGWYRPLLSRANVDILVSADSDLGYEHGFKWDTNDPHVLIYVDEGVRLDGREPTEDEMTRLVPLMVHGIAEPVYDLGDLGICWEFSPPK